MLRIVLVRPGATEFDEQGRIKGTLSIPLSDQGSIQASSAARGLSAQRIDAVYTSPCQAALQSAETLADSQGVKLKRMDRLQNLNQGLWEGKLIDEVRQRQPKVYRKWQEDPETICPPEGEMIDSARQRCETALNKLVKKHRQGIVALVAPEPLASVIRASLVGTRLGDLWKAEGDCGSWEMIDIEPDELPPIPVGVRPAKTAVMEPGERPN